MWNTKYIYSSVFTAQILACQRYDISLYHNMNKLSRWQTNTFFLICFLEKNWPLLQITSKGDNLYENSKPIFWGKKKNTVDSRYLDLAYLE